MQIEELKKGFWGYQKEGVFQYIAAQEETFSQRLMEKDAAAAREAELAQKRIRDLEQENAELRRELKTLREQQERISSTLLDARACAEAMKAESQAEEEAARAQVRQTLEQDLEQLKTYRGRIERLRVELQALLRETEQKAEALEQKVETVTMAVPEANLSLFQ